MRTKYKYVHFKKVDNKWHCVNKSGIDFGTITPEDDMTCLCLWSNPNCIFTLKVLPDIIAFMKQLEKK